MPIGAFPRSDAASGSCRKVGAPPPGHNPNRRSRLDNASYALCVATASLRRMNRAHHLVLAGILAGLTLVACGKDDATGGKDEPKDVTMIDGKEADVKVLDNSFNDENIQ